MDFRSEQFWKSISVCFRTIFHKRTGICRTIDLHRLTCCSLRLQLTAAWTLNSLWWCVRIKTGLSVSFYSVMKPVKDVLAVPFSMKPLCCGTLSLRLRGSTLRANSASIFLSYLPLFLSHCRSIFFSLTHPLIHSICLSVFLSISPLYSLTHSFSQMQWIGQTNPPVCPSAPSNIVNIWYSVHSPVHLSFQRNTHTQTHRNAGLSIIHSWSGYE